MTPFAKVMLAQPRPDRVRPIAPPRRENYAPSPVDWQNEVLYFIVVDRFSVACAPIEGLSLARPVGSTVLIGLFST